MKVKGNWKKFYRIGFLVKINIRLDIFVDCKLQTAFDPHKKKKKRKTTNGKRWLLMFLSAYSGIFYCKSIEEGSDANEAY